MRPIAEKVITKAKKGGLHNHRQILAYLGDQEIAAKLMDDVGPRYAEPARWLHPDPEARARARATTPPWPSSSSSESRVPTARIHAGRRTRIDARRRTAPSGRSARVRDRVSRESRDAMRPRRLRLDLSYDGSGFQGFAENRDVDTVGGRLAARSSRCCAIR